LGRFLDRGWSGRFSHHFDDDANHKVYGKEVLQKEDTLEPNELRLTEADIARYITRHLSSQKRAY